MIGDRPRYVMDDESKEENDRTVFVRDAMPGEWREYANELRDSAELLWHDRNNGLRTEYSEYVEVENGELRKRTETKKVYSVSRPYVLLAGFAIENLMKGCLVASNPPLINEGKLAGELKTHKLTLLVEKIDGLSLVKDERRFCEIAESAIPYWGRYPVPLAFNNVMPEVGMDDELRRGFLSLFDRLDRKLYMEIRDGWDSGVGAKSGKKYNAKYDTDERKDKMLGS
jgi:hypothetical protein